MQEAIDNIISESHEGRMKITTVVIAHRLSTVKNADKIIVMKKGKIVEEGNHESLINIQGAYYELVKRQE